MLPKPPQCLHIWSPFLSAVRCLPCAAVWTKKKQQPEGHVRWAGHCVFDVLNYQRVCSVDQQFSQSSFACRNDESASHGSASVAQKLYMESEEEDWRA